MGNPRQPRAKGPKGVLGWRRPVHLAILFVAGNFSASLDALALLLLLIIYVSRCRGDTGETKRHWRTMRSAPAFSNPMCLSAFFEIDDMSGCWKCVQNGNGRARGWPEYPGGGSFFVLPCPSLSLASASHPRQPWAALCTTNPEPSQAGSRNVTCWRPIRAADLQEAPSRCVLPEVYTTVYFVPTQ
ncbi:hypothetical protein B0T25DRAFT_292374 [Lasiosphaeria hispida]|uniref:Uncharacterized protein n=1 Tax=Lasiosphaeria hispida TaxID=260671 RepID=A0AAJ0MB76_9PEZI|nr:hypothetical protein B0T25DRAFT_292374 [Lasiosphaeria hispida]